MSTTDLTTDTLREVEQFLYVEAELLDERDFPAWLELFTKDCIYWIPGGAGQLDPSRKVSLVYDSWQTLAERVWRFEGGLAYAQQPQSTTSHLIGNVRVVRDEPELVVVTSTFVVSEFRDNALHTHAGRCEHQLVRVVDGLRIKAKRVDLVSRAGYLGNLSLPL